MTLNSFVLTRRFSKTQTQKQPCGQKKSAVHSGNENYQSPEETKAEERLGGKKDSLSWYDETDVVPTSEAMQNMIAFH